MRSSKAVAGIAMALLLLAGTGASAAEEAAKSNPWAGSSFLYEHAFSAISLDKSAEQTWNPYYAHSFSLQPKWKFHDYFGMGLRIDVEQELTNSDDTVRRYEWVWSDLLVDLNAGKGYTESFTGIKVTGGLRLTLPVSKASRARELVMSVGPGAVVSRKFTDLFGTPLSLTVGYNARWTYHFQQATTAQYSGPTISCGDPSSPVCERYVNTGIENPEHLLGHGASLSLDITDKLSFSTSYTFQRSRLYELSDFEFLDGAGQKVVLEADHDVAVRYYQWFIAELSYQALDVVGVALGVSTLHGDLATDGTYRTPFFNRFTNIYLNLSLDIDSVVSRFQ
ncbi:MAG: hypothetical protein ACOX6T_21755 [Myxococcales bacterium]|jgi:hypothetical protein